MCSSAEFKNVLSGSVRILSFSTTVFKYLHFANTSVPNSLTLCGSLISESLLSWKHLLPIFFN